MFRKDFISSEIEKLTQALARIIGLKKDGKIEEAHEHINETLFSGFGITPVIFENFDPELFRETLKGYSEKKLDILAQLLFESSHPFEDLPETESKLHAVLAIFNIIEREHKTQSLDNLAKREMIDKFLNNQQYE